MALDFPSDTSTPYIDPTSGLKYIFNASIGAWEAAIQPPAIVSASQPDIEIEGFMWWDNTSNILYVYEMVGGLLPPLALVVLPPLPASENEPAGATASDLWWDNGTGRLYIYYTDVILLSGLRPHLACQYERWCCCYWNFCSSYCY